jgi:hypothetical protein
MLNLCGIVAAILKMATSRNFSMSGINSGHYCLELIPDIEKFLPIAIFKMAATIPQKFNIVRYHQNCRNFSMSGINSGHYNLATYEMSLKSDNVEFVRYCGGHFENGNR